MSTSFEIPELISAIDNLIEKKDLRKKDPSLTLMLAEKMKKMEVWFLGRIYLDNSRFMQKVADLCHKGRHDDIRKIMAFARYAFRHLGPDRFEDRIQRSSLTSDEKKMLISCFRIGEMDGAIAQMVPSVIEADSQISCN
ncbi:MAG TPA: hypothetical protein VK452_05860 [Dissulfurispiraceae bacterium]|nr:hypothetical protein [Dissulfurispiraceae bacterium]